MLHLGNTPREGGQEQPATRRAQRAPQPAATWAPAARAAVQSVLELEPIWYRSNCEDDDPNLSQYGFAAEDVAAVDPRLATSVEDADGNLVPDNVDVVAITALLVSAVKAQRDTIAELSARIETLEGN